MCGIAGFLRLADRASGEPDLSAMTRTLTHRGPDSEGFFQADGVGLGMRRLRVIDLETGDQPMTDERGRLQLVFNGEIYNFRELRAELVERGHRFSTRCDTEVLVHGWEEWGPALPHRLRGMFAFAIWDPDRRSLFLARDHFGIKPLYYTEHGGYLLFGSEIKALQAAAPISREIEPRAVDCFLSFLYIREPDTIFRAVRALPPGHLLRIENGRLQIERYYRFSPRPGVFRSRDEAIEAVRETFADSVRAMMVADVPVGLFLSGGIDSAAILARMARSSEEPVRSFSIGFGQREHRWDELDQARALAAAFGAEHREFRIEPDVVQLLPRVLHHFDQPFGNPTAVILHLLCGEARKHTTVALSGTGGDELFAGYPRYLGMRIFERYRLLPAPLRRLAAGLARQLLRDKSDGRLLFHRARRFFEGGVLPFDACYARLLVVLEEARRRELYTPAFAESLAEDRAEDFVLAELRREIGPGIEQEDRLLATDIATYLPFNQLTYGDRMSMAQSLEIRVPFVDQRLAEVAAGIPLAWHLKGRTTKGLLREAMAPELPRDVVGRPKLGLNLPIALWMRGDLRPWLEELLSPGAIEERGLFRPEPVRRLMKEHFAGKRDHSLVLWSLAVLEVWQRGAAASG